MRTTLSFFAVALSGLAAASPAPHGGYYGYGHAAPSGTVPSGGVSTGVIPSSSNVPSGTGHGPYSRPSDTSVIPRPSGSASASVSPSGHGPYTRSSGTSVVPKPSGTGLSSSTKPAGTGLSSSTKPAGTGLSSSSTKPAGTGLSSSSTKPAGTGLSSSSTKPAGTGLSSSSTKPSGTGVGPHPSGTKSSTTPAGTGPSGTKSGPEVTSSLPGKPPIVITTVTRDVPSTTTIKHVHTTTVVRTITAFVPHSTPVATRDSSTYYSSYVSVDYSTITVTLTSTGYEVVVPKPTPNDSKPTGADGHGPGYSSVPGASPSNAVGHNQVPGHGSDNSNHGGASLVSIVPVPSKDAIPSYLPHTSYAPQVGDCPPAKVVYSTVVIEVTKTVEVPSKGHDATIIPPPLPPAVSTIIKPGQHQPPYPVPSGSGKPPRPSGTGTGLAGTGYIPLPTGYVY